MTMQDDDYSGGAVSIPGAVAQERTFVARVYGLMFVGLAITAVMAFLASMKGGLGPLFYTEVESIGRSARHGLQPTGLFWGAVVLEIVVWLAFVFGQRAMNWVMAGVLFVAYAALNGIVLSIALLVYTKSSVMAAFLVSSGIFGIFALYGHFTKRDLTSVGSLCMMAFCGLLLATIVNMFMASNTLSWILTYGGVVIFVGLVAYMAQQIREYAAAGLEGTDEDKHAAIIMALALYIQFINILWHLIRILGDRR
jgi:hypothetical protein